jgi:outer membrane receptor protein involved in Fe transport
MVRRFPARKSLSVFIACLAALTASRGSFAQNAIEEISVTGTRIRQSSGMVTPVPVTAITPAELTNFDPGGTVAEQLNGLPGIAARRVPPAQ